MHHFNVPATVACALAFGGHALAVQVEFEPKLDLRYRLEKVWFTLERRW